MPTLLVRADASPTIGTGHVMRQIALAQAWRKAGGRTVFAMHAPPESIAKRLTDDRFEVLGIDGSPDATAAAARHIAAQFAVLDGYQFGVDYHRALRNAGACTLAVDDNGEVGEYESNFVLNQNLHASTEMYARRGVGTQLLLGPRYALLRDEFSTATPIAREYPPTARKVLVTMGGADPSDVTAQVLESLRLLHVDGLRGLTAQVIVGAVNPRVPVLRQAAHALEGAVEILSDVKDMPARMAHADVAISAAGSTCWELASSGLPSLVTVVAPNQRRLAESLQQAGVARNLGDGARLSPFLIATALRELAFDLPARVAMSRNGRALLDGDGAARVVDALRAQQNGGEK